MKNIRTYLKKYAGLFLLAIFLFSGCQNWDVLDEKEKDLLDGILKHWETWVPAKKAEGSAPLLTFKQLYEGLTAEQMDFLDRVRSIRPSSLDFDPTLPLKKIEGQPVFRKDGSSYPMGIQYLPVNVYEAVEKMMTAMQKDLGKRLYVESGYRSPAYQLYTFLFYCPKHGYSLKETNKWVALPGHSEHGNPSLQASDFINAEGINGDSDNNQTAKDFDSLPEFKWLTESAAKFGFVLSYPPGHATTHYEPWHWRYEGTRVES